MKKIHPKIEKEFRKIEGEINDWVKSHFIRREIGISIQIRTRGQIRDSGYFCNNFCRKVYFNLNPIEKKESDKSEINDCDKSDEFMKNVVIEHDHEFRECSWGYICHCGLSNLIIPYYGNKYYSDEKENPIYYIFIGQFKLIAHNSNIDDYKEQYNIKELDHDSEPNGVYKGFFYNEKTFEKCFSQVLEKIKNKDMTRGAMIETIRNELNNCIESIPNFSLIQLNEIKTIAIQIFDKNIKTKKGRNITDKAKRIIINRPSFNDNLLKWFNNLLNIDVTKGTKILIIISIIGIIIAIIAIYFK